jgi:hypothetical protein
MADAGAAPRTLWNHGYVLYYRYPPSRESAQALADAFRQATAARPDQAEMLKGAARHWKNKADHWNDFRPVAWKTFERDFPYKRPQGQWESTLPLARPHDGASVISPRRPPRTWDRPEKTRP